ncbi:PREDICTED: uncharacterized protein LOC107336424 [Paramuricea clavata]|uniref:PREDICTED: uncharacterized protein LOC107336424 n=1 Tax=Paramuricea clavata TaxID=317549 RepID=A0A6S7GCM6_PARCT|nr:PREDICTED: uncharacterized protein LOC107336424 [Paramuricea clavata]
MDFADPQGGKGTCDRKAATIKPHMKIFHDEGNNIESASDMKTAILSSGGVPAVNVAVSGPPDDSEFSKVEIKGVSFYTNVEYTRGGFKVWKAYNIGKGKVIPRNKFSISSFSVPQVTNLDIGSQESQSEFLTVKSKKKSEKEEDDLHSESLPVSREDIVDDQNESHLFSCPEPGCIKRYQRFHSLQRHLDCGKHKRELEQETIFDRAAIGYAERLDKQSGCVPELQAFQNAKSPRQHVLSMGWAPKSAQTKRTRFNEKQKNYMTTKFNIRETTGFKANPADVAKAMMTTKDDNGDRMFTSEEFVTTQQVSSYFSHLASKKRLPNAQDDDDALAAENETDLQDLQELVVQETVAIKQLEEELEEYCLSEPHSRIISTSIDVFVPNSVLTRPTTILKIYYQSMNRIPKYAVVASTSICVIRHSTANNKYMETRCLMHRRLTIGGSPWLKNYIDFNTKKRRIGEEKDCWDNSDYPKDSPYYSAHNKKVIGKFKDEAAGVPVIEFVGLRSKMYSYVKESGGGGMTAKGVKKTGCTCSKDGIQNYRSLHKKTFNLTQFSVYSTLSSETKNSTNQRTNN